jgi:hypothetical protein
VANLDLVNYFLKQRADCYPDELIKGSILAAGWQVADMEDAFVSIVLNAAIEGKPDVPSPVRKMRERKPSLLPLIIVAVLCAALGLAGRMWHGA